MPFSAGARLGPYEVLGLIGTGGMGEVYRAHDSQLGRHVALKILPDHFALDADRLARFKREAQILASLSHPNIATIHGLQESDGTRALVLELVEGPTLADQIALGAIPIDEALAIARQIADALEAAHEQGIVHRDLKPANIKRRPDGTVKVLDFGLAKASDPSAGSASDASQSPTFTTPAATMQGVILGTAAYMSPEQARGQTVDKRTDVWAFGCVLYEMLTGRAAFAGDTVSDTMAAILAREPDWSCLPGTTPAGVRRLLQRCLRKNAKQRVRDIGDVRLELDEGFGTNRGAAEVAERGAARRRRALRWAATSAVLLTAGGLSVWLWMLGANRNGTPPPVTRSTATLPTGLDLDTNDGAAPLALSVDGRRLVYGARDASRPQLLYLRDLGAFEAKPLAGTDGARYPFFSPDGQWVGFFAGGKLQRVSISGGSPITICDAPQIGRGGTWAPDGTIVFDPGVSGLMRVPAAGGRPEAVTSRDPEMDARDLSWPQFLPGGQALLATVNCHACVDAELGVLSLETGQWQLLGAGSQAQYLSPGYLVYHAVGVREGEVHAVAFDSDRLAIHGEPASVLEGVFRAPAGGGAYFVASRSGTMVFVSGGHGRTLVQIDRHGRRTPLTDDRRGFRMPSVSPDGSHVAVTIDPRPSQLWIYDLVRRSGIPLSTQGHHVAKVWTPNARHVVYSNNGDMHRKAADGSGEAQRLLARELPQYPQAWSKDGKLLIFTEDHPTNGSDIWVLPEGGEPRSLITAHGDQQQARLSSDDRWLAYMSNETGRFEVHVRPFPNVDDARWIVSTDGGGFPAWVPSGRELFYLNGTTMMSVPIENGRDTFTFGVPEPLFSGPFHTGSPEFDVSPDGTFVMVEADPDARPTQIHLVQNWHEELKRLVPIR